MKAIQITETGGPEVLKYLDVADPHPGQGEVLVRLDAIGVNYMDVYTRTGLYPNSSLPIIPGGEGSGRVTEIGANVTEVEVGDLVAYTGVGGSYAEQVVAPSWRLVRIPDGLDAEIAAAVMLQGMTAHYLCRSTYPLGPDDTCLIHASAGGVGLLLTQMAKSLGATVIGTVSTKEKQKLSVDAGADYVINYKDNDFEKEVLDISSGKGVQVVYDAVGVDTFEKSIRCLDTRGYMVLYGQSSGLVPPISPMLLNSKSLFLTRPTLASYTASREEILNRSGDVLESVKTGQLKVRIHRRFQLENADEAHTQLEGRLTTGKLLLIP